MPISHENVTAALNLMAALSQRQDTIRQLANQLHTGVIWRSLDGKLTVAIPPAEIAQLEEFMKGYLDESQTITSALRAMLAGPKT